jgi:imidazolonepropionase-like amidohydrolase/ABC-type multidrug transport system permease subunit
MVQSVIQRRRVPAFFRSYLALIAIDLKLALRNRSVIFFNYLFPLMFFFIFAQAFHAEQGGVINQVVTMSASIGILGNGLFGAGMRAVQEREMNILRRYKVTPISPAPLLVASMVTGWIIFLPYILLMLALAHFGYGMHPPQQLLSLLVFVSVGLLAFRAFGLIVASVANSMQESGILVQICYMPMMFLSGATFPVTMFPAWLLVLTQFIPATYLVSGMQGILMRNESLAANWKALVALLLTAALALFVSAKLFRWEKEERIRASAKLWLLGALLPFLILGVYQAYSHENVGKTRVLARDLRRSRTLLIRGARIFVGDGKVIESGGILVRNGKIEEVYEGVVPDAKTLNADTVEAAGKTVLPGLIDLHVHLAASGGIYATLKDYQLDKVLPLDLAAYLYSGITAVRSVGDPVDSVLKARTLMASGERLGAELFLCGPLFTTEGGHGTEYFKWLPEMNRVMAERQFVRTPATAQDARAHVVELKHLGVDAIKGVLEAGWAGNLFNRMDLAVLQAIAEESRGQGLPFTVHTGDSRDVADALSAGATGIEHGSFRDQIPDALFAEMVRQGVTYDPTLSVVEALSQFLAGHTELLDRSLLQQVGPQDLIDGTKTAATSPKYASMRQQFKSFPWSLERAKDNLLRAWRAGVLLVTGTDAGNFMVFHGPTVHRELQLWKQAGIPPQVALQAATYNAARALRAEDRIGSIRKGLDADLLLVDGNPLQEIEATERISLVIFKGERVDRSELFTPP